MMNIPGMFSSNALQNASKWFDYAQFLQIPRIHCCLFEILSRREALYHLLVDSVRGQPRKEIAHN
jgi:hypothetical protein